MERQESQQENEETPNNNNEAALVPQLSDDGITQHDLNIAIKVLSAVAELSRRNNKKRKQSNEPPEHSNDNIDKGNGPDTTDNNDKDDSTEDGLELFKKPNLRPLRKALAGCLELHKRSMFGGKEEEEHYEQRKLERSLKRQKMAERDLQKKHIADTALRKGRVERLNNLKEDARQEEESKLLLLSMMVPDGHVDTRHLLLSKQQLQEPKLLKQSAENGEQKEQIRNVSGTNEAGENGSNIKLPKLRSCYVCKKRYRELHHFYDQLCPTCALLNWEKRHQTCNMAGRVAIVTGARVKIGYQTCLKLLRAGATVVATTRFPNSAAAVYRREVDFHQWKDQLQIYGLDLRDVTGLEAFTRFLKMTFPGGIDVLINNACQTVRRPPAFYIPQVQEEEELWKQSDDVHRNMLQGCIQFENLRQKLHHQHHHGHEQAKITHDSGDAPLLLMGIEDGAADSIESEGKDSGSTQAVTIAAKMNGNDNQPNFEKSGLSHSAAMSQMIILPEDVGVSDSILPPGMTDINGQQLDLRKQNSWLLKMDEVSTPEIMECFFINAIAPFVLNSRLKPLMTIPQDDKIRPDRFIINVSAMEGKFYRYKMANHPHTNMAKAALNMMTRTAAEDLATKHRIYMNSVDTGWINDENPLEKASKIAATNLFQTPIDEIDAAARILDPVFSGINGGRESEKDYGKFLKDYRETEW